MAESIIRHLSGCSRRKKTVGSVFHSGQSEEQLQFKQVLTRGGGRTMSAEEESKNIDFEDDILLHFGKRTLAVLGILLVPLVANQLEPPWTAAIVAASIAVWLLIEGILWLR